MKAHEFTLDQFARPGKYQATLDFDAAGHAIQLPLLIVCGAAEGKMLVVTAGVHGDEYEGVLAIFETYRELDPGTLSGSLVMVPVANPPAFWNGTRTSPLDDGNLARVFPGFSDGPPTETIAWHLDQYILSTADFYLDLHSAGVKCLMPTLVGYHEPDPVAREAALVFGAPVVWCHPSVAEGRTVSAAIARGIPALYTEARGAGRIDPEDLGVYRRGIRNLLRYLGMTPGVLEAVPTPLRIYGNGNIDASLTASIRGFLEPSVTLLQAVTSGQELGVLSDLHGNVIERYAAPDDGLVVLIHAFPVVQPGEPLFLVTGVHS